MFDELLFDKIFDVLPDVPAYICTPIYSPFEVEEDSNECDCCGCCENYESACCYEYDNKTILEDAIVKVVFNDPATIVF